MDKTDINNFIVSLRSLIVQARVHICNKLVQERRKLLNKKGSEDQKKKNAQKAERLLKEVLIMKKLENDQITKYVLLCGENPLERFHKCVLEPEERVKLRFAIHKNISKRIDEFRTTFPDWALKLSPIIVQLGMRYKMRKKKDKQTDKKKIMNNKDEDNEKSQLANKSNKKHLSEPVRIEKEAKEEDDKQLKQENVISNDNVAAQRRPLEKKSDRHIAEIRKLADILELEKNKEDNLNLPLKNKEKNVGVASLSPESKTKGLIAREQRLKDSWELESNNIMDSGDDSDQSSSSTDNVPSHVTSDPFFFAGSESEASENEDSNCSEGKYVKSVSVTFKNELLNPVGRNNRMTKQDEHSTHTHGKKVEKNAETVPSLNRKQRRLLKRLEAEKGLTDFRADDISKILKMHKSTKNKSFSLKQRQTEEVESLHPSWEAKRKQREILPFQGKKIKFDID